jgi:hypothetical protein
MPVDVEAVRVAAGLYVDDYVGGKGNLNVVEFGASVFCC